MQTSDDLQRVVIDFGKCCRADATGAQMELHEPIDVLMHALHLCNDAFVHMDLQTSGGGGGQDEELEEEIRNHSHSIDIYFDRLRDNILQGLEQDLLDTYKAQVMLVIAKARRGGGANLLVAKPSGPITTQTTSSQRPTQQQAVVVDELSQLAPFYQAFLGTIEVLIEHFFKLGLYKYKPLN